MEERQRRLERLRDRFVAVNLRSRSVRVLRPTRSGVVDLLRLREASPAALEVLLAGLGRGELRLDLLAMGGAVAAEARDGDGAALAADVSVLARRAHEAWLETGADDLALGWPFLEGRSAEGAWLRGPLLLFPAALEPERRGAHRWVLKLQGLPTLNEALAQALARLAGVTLALDDLLGGDDDRLLVPDDGTWRGLGATLRALGLPLDEGGLPPLLPIEPRTLADREAAPAGRFALRNHLALGRFPASASAVVGDYDTLLSGEPTDERLGLAAALLRTDEEPVAGAGTLRREAAAVPARRLRPPRPRAGAGVATSESAHLPAADAARVRRTVPRGPFSPECPGGAAPPARVDLRRAMPLDSDSSQDEVLRWVEGGARGPAGAAPGAGGARGLVVQGPPGTGKSQLIANLLAGCMARGLRALLVCSKRAALDVVAERLAAVGLAEPIALVHDVVRDRAAVMGGIAATLAGGDAPVAAGLGDPVRRLEARIAVADEAWAAIAAPRGGRPSLAALDELSLDEGRGVDASPDPELDAEAAGATLAELEATVPRMDAWAREAEALARPHPLWVRDDWAAVGEPWIDASFERVAAVRGLVADALRAAGAGALRPRRARELRAVLQGAAPVLEALGDPGRAARLDLFWGWCGGGQRDGEWRQLADRLERARRELRPVPRELVLAQAQRLEAWASDLLELAALQRRFFRWLLPRFWRLRRVPGEVGDLCASWAGRLAAEGPPGAIAPHVSRLVEGAAAWQALIAEMPLDHPFVDFGFQGDPQDVERALGGIRGLSSLVSAIHEAHRALADEAPAYAALPADGVSSSPLCAALRADSEALAALDAAEERIAAGAFDSGFAAACRAAVEAARDGRPEACAGLDALLGARADVPRAQALDALLAPAPAWARRFLRSWRGPGAGEAARWAVVRAWRRLALGGRPRAVVEAPLVDPAARRALATELFACRDGASEQVIAAYRGRIAAGLADPALGPALRRLAEDAGRQRRRLTLRQLVGRGFREVVSLARPIWLCSPETVSALFPLEGDLFDLVIFDEASQCPVEAGLPALVRASRALIAGDEQQMPPSHFFEARDEEDDEDEAVLATESLLSLARVAFGQTMLRWHYRSRCEELIGFSNHAFYGGQLRVAPGLVAAGADGEGLHWHRVDGVWEEQRNRVEARAVVELLAGLLGRRRDDGQLTSVGVIAFNLRQADLVEELVEERAAADPAFAELLRVDRARPPLEQLFVRNLENVQGDERDVIVFTVAYGPSASGAVQARFGPLGLVGGEKRLNVAITRARRAIHVVTSLEPDDLAVDGARHAGPRVLREWLRYVRAMAADQGREAAACLDAAASLVGAAGAQAQRAAPEARIGARVRAELAARLRAAGLEVAERHGLSAGRLDLAVRTPGAAAWRVGVDCSAFLTEPDALARDVYTPRLWERLGWRVLRVTPGQWLEDADAVVQRVQAAVSNRRSALSDQPGPAGRQLTAES